LPGNARARWHAAGRRSAIGAGALVVLAGCSETTYVQTAPSQVVVHAVLDKSKRDQLILLERTRAVPPGPQGGTAGQFEPPILGAQITITAPNGLVMVAREDRLTDSLHATRGLYRLSLDEYGATLVQGRQYVLHIRTDLGEEISGSTTIPGGAAATASPPEPFNRSTDTLRLSWQRVSDAQSYEVRIQYDNPASPYFVFADSSISIPGLSRTLNDDVIFFPKSNADVLVSAVDANYYEYYRSVSDPFLGAPPSHLTGAVGVFGSLVPLTVRHLTVQ
jgi:hypothetical protein